MHQLRTLRFVLPVVVLLLGSALAFSQSSINGATSRLARDSDGAALPNAPEPQDFASTRPQPVLSGQPLTLHERFILQLRSSLGPAALILPASEAGIIMADPPHRYPREWSDGGGAFGRNYGSELGRHFTRGMTHFAVAAAAHEDPRYYACACHNIGARMGYALLFTISDRNNAGHRTFAFSNFAGAAAGGFVGNLWEPDGFNDTIHGGQRASVEVITFVSHNLLSEFAPELQRFARKAHLPKFAANAVIPEGRVPPPDQP